MDQSIDALAVIRNVLIHASGITDRKFLDESEGISQLTPIRALGLGAKIEFDGQLVKSLVDPITPIGYALLSETDKWLQLHRVP